MGFFDKIKKTVIGEEMPEKTDTNINIDKITLINLFILKTPVKIYILSYC